jgi:cytoskeletal protein RodZ
MPDITETLPTEETPVVVRSSISIGEARKRVGMTVDQLARRTRITTRIINALEANDRESLPASVFVRGYLRAIATELNVDVAPWLDPWKEVQMNAGAFGDETKGKEPEQWWRKRVFSENIQVPVHIGHVLAVVLAILTFFLLYFAIEGSSADRDSAAGKDNHSLIETLDTRPIQGR